MANKQTTSVRETALPPGSPPLSSAEPAPVEEPIITSSFRAPEDGPLTEEWLQPASFQRGARLVARVREAFSHRRYGRARYRLHLEALETPSTPDGRLPRQRLALVSRKDAAHSISCGWVDVSRKRAQVRSYAVVSQRYRSRHGSVPAIREEEYKRFLGALIDTLFDEGIRLVLLIPDARSSRLAQLQAWIRQSSLHSLLGVLLLCTLAFALGRHSELLTSWLAQLPSWMESAAQLIR